MVPLPFKEAQMKLENLSKFDSTIKTIAVLQNDYSIDSLSDTYELKENCIIFVKNKNFLQEILDKRPENKKLIFILEQKFFDGIKEEQLSELKKFAAAIATSQDVNASMSFLSRFFFEKKFGNPNDLVDGRQMGTASVHPTAFIAQGVFIGENVKVGPMVKIHPGVVLMSGVEIEESSEIFSNTTIYRNAKIGKNVRIHAGCTIGADGFGYNFVQGKHQKVWHIGGVVIHDHVEIGANSCVDSGTFSPTIIGEGTKIDNLCQIGHNAHVGKHVVLCAGVALAGSCTLEDYVVMGGMSAVSNGITVKMAAQVAAMSGVTSDVQPKQVVGGFPARDIKEWMRGNATLRKLSLTKSKES